MSERITIVIPSQLNKELEKMQKTLNMDKSSLIRHLITISIDNFKVQNALENFKKGKISMGQAVEAAGLNYWAFLEECHKNQIQLDLSEEEAKMGIKKVAKMDFQEYRKQKSKKG